jgi:hypothetical protein
MNNARDFCDHNTQKCIRINYLLLGCKILILAKQTSLCPSGSHHMEKVVAKVDPLVWRVLKLSKNKSISQCLHIRKDFHLGHTKKLWQLFGPLVWDKFVISMRTTKIGRVLLSTRRALEIYCLSSCHISSYVLNLRTSNNLRSCKKDSLQNIPSIIILYWKLAHCFLNCSNFPAIHTFTKNGTAVFSLMFDIPFVSLILILYELYTVQHSTFYINTFNTYFFQATCFGYILSIIRPTWTVELALDAALFTLRTYCSDCR